MEDNKKYDVERLRSLRLEKQILGYLLKSEENIKDYYDVSVLLTEKVFADKYNKQIFNVIISLLKSASQTNHGLPPKSNATCAKHSSIGNKKP